MEGWTRQANRDRDVLMRIVALLVSLAGLADCAGNLSGRRRRCLLQLLWYAEAVGCDFIVGLMPAQLADYDEPEPDGDVGRLAASFRMLALVLYTMLQWCAAAPRAVGRLDAGFAVFGNPLGRATMGVPDTS